MDDQRPEAIEQVERFKQAARDLGCDEDEVAWDERLKKIAKRNPEPPKR